MITDSRHVVVRSITLPFVWLCVWLIFLGVSVRSHAYRSVQPPLYDAFTYYQKGQNFWQNIHAHRIRNPLNLQPTVRPPGTVLMSYPFGFNVDFHGFYFRSTYMPALLLLAAVLLAGYRERMSSAERWDLTLLAMLASALPMFYHFEMNGSSPVYWGLVDGFLVGVSALATAALIQAQRRFSLRWLTCATLLASLCLLIKPSGVFIMMLIGLAFALALALELPARDSRRQTIRFAVSGLAIMAVVFGLDVLACVRSQYLSAQGRAWGNATIAIMRSEVVLPLTYLPGLIHTSIGFAIPLLLIICVMLYWYQRRRREISLGSDRLKECALLGSATASLVFGIWFWIVWSGGATQVRYFAPFALISVMLLVPFVAPALNSSSKGIRSLFRAICLALVLNFALLMALKDPSPAWQERTGVNVSTGTHSAELIKAKMFADELRRSQTNGLVYSFFSNAAISAIEGLFNFESFAGISPPQILVERPTDWRQASVVRIGQILNAEYVLLQPRSELVRKQILSRKVIRDVQGEIDVFDSWFTPLTKSQGVEMVFETPAAKLVKIVDSQQLEKSLAELVSTHEWPQTFTDANPRRWWTETELRRDEVDAGEVVRDVQFDNLLCIRKLEVGRHGDSLNVKVWTRPIERQLSHGLIMFFHQVDAKDNILANDELYLPGPSSHPERDVYVLTTTNIALTQPNNAITLALGIRTDEHNYRLLMASNGNRDWGNRRVLLPIPPSTTTSMKR